MIQFYAPDLEKENRLPESESGHCCRVLRKTEGDEIIVTDGKGKRFICEITHAHPKHTEVMIKETITVAPIRDYYLVLAVAPTKNSDRIEWLVEKAVELGVDKIVLLRCDRSERKVQKTERLEKVAISAMKQSKGSWLPEITEIVSIREFINSSINSKNKFFGYCSEEFPRREFVKECHAGEDVIIMIGPEGDFSPEEVTMAVESGFMPVTFGESRLRTETAALFAVAAVNILNQLNS